MLTLRLHLDACDERNGPLRVLSGSHRDGKLNASQIAEWRENTQAIEVHAPPGGALLMRPLLLHASSPSQEPTRSRRVLHVEWAGEELPEGLEWWERV
jgi:ectoine hydroxylase-related dioxygenase (phytanoyl-CoA dioxygenase family)